MAVQFVIGDLLNLNLPVRAEDVRGFVNSLFRANILLHVDGEPIGAGLAERLEVALGLDDHQVHVEDAGRRRATP